MLGDYVTIQTATQNDQTYTLRDLNPDGLTWSVNPFQVQTLPITHTLCGDLLYSATFEADPVSDTSTPLSLSSTSLEFALYSEDPTLAGERTITLSATFADYAVDPSTESFTVTIIDPCDNPVSVGLDVGESFEDQEYIITDAEKTYLLPSFVADPVWCDVTVTVVSSSSAVTYDSATGEVKFLW